MKMKLFDRLLILIALFAAGVFNAEAQMIERNYNGVGTMYANTPGVTEIGTAPNGYTGGAAQSTGAIGEVLTAGTASGSAITVTTTATSYNVLAAPLSLTAGDWEVDWCVYVFAGSGSTSFTVLQGGVSGTSATLPVLTAATPVAYGSEITAASVPAQTTVPQTLSSGSVQINVSATTSEYLVVQCTFTSTSPTASGWIKARRIR